VEIQAATRAAGTFLKIDREYSAQKYARCATKAAAERYFACQTAEREPAGADRKAEGEIKTEVM
jgi:hypothetical protein